MAQFWSNIGGVRGLVAWLGLAASAVIVTRQFGYLAGTLVVMIAAMAAVSIARSRQRRLAEMNKPASREQ
jgi:membrane protein implicated in regulation of membrane protease activity